MQTPCFIISQPLFVTVPFTIPIQIVVVRNTRYEDDYYKTLIITPLITICTHPQPTTTHCRPRKRSVWLPRLSASKLRGLPLNVTMSVFVLLSTCEIMLSPAPYIVPFYPDFPCLISLEQCCHKHTYCPFTTQ